MAYSAAFKDLEKSIETTKQLITIEKKHFSKPNTDKDFKAIEGLRGGAVVFLVAAFENYMRNALAEYIEKMATLKPLLDVTHLPDNIKTHMVFTSLNYAMKGKPYEQNKTKHDRLPDVLLTCKSIISGALISDVFCNTNSNPKSDTINTMLKNIGMNKFLQRIQADFEKKWKTSVSETFIAHKLDSIVNVRHRIAHTGTALNISVRDIKEYIEFIHVLTKIIDKSIGFQIRNIHKKAITSR